MEYSRLVEAYQELEATQSTDEKSSILAELFREAEPEELEVLGHLAMGRAFPAWKDLDMGIGSKLMVKAVARATGNSEEAVEDGWRETGDLGDTVERFVEGKKQSTLADKELDLSGVQENLERIAAMEGEGSEDKKISRIAELVTFAAPEEAKYLVRTVIEDLRVGVGEGLVRDAIIKAFFAEVVDGKGFTGKLEEGGLKVAVAEALKEEVEGYGLYDSFSKDNDVEFVDPDELELGELWRPEGHDLLVVEEEREWKDRLEHVVQHAYDVSTDLGRVARTAAEEGVEGLEKMEMELFQPVKVMLAQKTESMKEGFEKVADEDGVAAVEYKYDGFRCISGHTPIYVKGKSMLSVKDVTAGDEVLTHSGEFKEVEATNKRTIDEEERVFRFSTYLGNDFKITEGHEMLVEEDGGRTWRPVEEVNRWDAVVFPIPKYETRKNVPETIELTAKGNYTKEIAFDTDFFRFIGCWVGDGYSNRHNNNRRLGIVFNENDTEMMEYYQSIVEDVLQIPPEDISKHSHGGGTSLYWTDYPLLQWIAQNFRKRHQDGWKDKKLPEWFWNIDEEQFEAFLEGWKDADGTKDDQGRESIVTKEKGLATHVQLLALKFGEIIGIRKVRVDNKTYYKLIFTKSNRYAEINGDYVSVKVLKNEELSWSNPQEVDSRHKVYNLQVKDDESYCTTMAALHNCQIHKGGEKVKVFSRRLEDVTEQFPDIVESVREQVDAEECIIEGEVVAYDPDSGSSVPFQKLSRRIKRKYDIREMVEKIPVTVYLFDVIELEGEEMIEEPLRERWKSLTGIVEDSDEGLSLAHHLETDNLEEARTFYQEALNDGQEGVMLKNLEAGYKPGSRVGYMVKLKPVMETLDLVIVEADWGEGRRSNWLGSYMLACRDGETEEFRTVGKMATGFTDEQLEEMTNRVEDLIVEEEGRHVTLKPEVVVEVAYEEIQESPEYGSGYALRFPRLVRVRDNMGPEDGNELEKVESLYESQNE